MFGFKYIKFDAMTYVIHFKNGKIKKEGRGLSFFYTSYNSSIVALPLGSDDIIFIFNEATNDFQEISIQGTITYKISDVKKISELLDFTVDSRGNYKTEDREKLRQRLINEAQTATSSFIRSLSLKEAIVNAKNIEKKIMEGLKTSGAVGLLGVEILAVNVVAVKPTPEMSKALETTTREALQQEADAAIYQRRNFAVEQERKIKESQLNTEIAVKEKEKQIAEKRYETKILEAQKERELSEMKLKADIALEEESKNLIKLKSENEKKLADIEQYKLETSLKPYQKMDWKTIMAINPKGADAKLNIAVAFRELAENAERINNLNITPDLLDNLMGDEVQQVQR